MDKYQMLNKLSNSKFRSSFKLKPKDKEYVNKNGISVITNHAYGFINSRLAPAFIDNDGKQTPMKNHPVFIAQHATATCCRKCLYKWHKIKPNIELNGEEKKYIVDLIITWIKLEMNE